MATPPYTDTARVKALLSRHAESRPGTAGSIDDASLEVAIRSARTTIDARLGGVYKVPFDPVPDLIRDIATALAAWDADLTFREVRDYSSELNPILLRYKWATEMLAALVTGTAVIPGHDPGEGPADNPNDSGSVVGVVNPELYWPDSRCYPDIRTYEHWSQSW